jgi:hypothetical protein
LKSELQPRVQLIGNPITHAEVFTEMKIFKFKDILEAIDFGFLIYKAIGLNFPQISKDSWAVLTEVVYKIRYDKQISTDAVTLITDINFQLSKNT